MTIVGSLLSCLLLRFVASLLSNCFPPVALLFLWESHLTSRAVLEESWLDGSSKLSICFLRYSGRSHRAFVVSLATLRVVLEESLLDGLSKLYDETP